MRVTFGEFSFDCARRVLTRGAAPVALTPKAAALMEALVAAAPNPVTKEKLYELLWPGTFVETGNLHNLISELRGATGDDNHTTIRTVHRVGYSFSAPLVREQSAAPRLHIGSDVIDLAPGENIIGRERLGTPDVSRRHARLVVAGSTVTIEDLGSKNGTFVEGAKIAKKTTLRDGDEIVFGRTKATLRVIDAAAPTVTATGSRG